MNGMHSLEQISSIVYHKVSQIIGNKEIVTIRRDVMDINENIYNYINRKHHVTMISGSTREAFYMAGSDQDFMFWSVRDHVISYLSQISHYDHNSGSIICMEDRYTRPGFVLLELLNQNGNIFTLKSCIQLQGTIYISSFLYRDFMHSASLPLPNLVLHGPCTSASIDNHEFDFAPCFACDQWPPQAYSWIERCRIQHWPQSTVLRSIIQNGCHLVPIGAKNSPSELVEWRLSFSQAEYKLVYSMTECQFLTYGLLKLFLKEVLNLGLPESDKLLCSYFMKTVVFWNIQGENTIVWSSEKFLLCFWTCYKFLMKCVLTGYCPNFFVPENNMFFPKIMGRNQTLLFARMHALYNEGMACLLRCVSIHDHLYLAISDPNTTITNKCSEIRKDFELYYCLNNIIIPPTSRTVQRARNDHQNILNFLFEKCKSNTSSLQRLLIYQFTIWFCQQHLLFKQRNPIHGKHNIESYKRKTKDVRLMEVASKLGDVTSVAYLALYQYNDGRYTQALSLLHQLKSKLYKPFVFFNGHCNQVKYTQAMSGKSLYTKMNQAIASHIIIPCDIYFPELRLEQRVTEKLGWICLCISPFVLLHFLTFLCHYHLRSPQQEYSLQRLQTLVQKVLRNRKYGWCIDKHFRDIACEIVGICHQLSGHPQQALGFYMESLYQVPGNMIWEATCYRLQTLCFHFES